MQKIWKNINPYKYFQKKYNRQTINFIVSVTKKNKKTIMDRPYP